ncbi:MAG: Maf family protein [Gammaproteobacteria bacterium]
MVLPASGAALVLASGSAYRAELLRRLQLPFITAVPDVDETPLAGEGAAALAVRLALAKARAVAARHPGAWVIGSDQAADCGGHILGKPGSRQQAERQLQAMSGQAVEFHTACAVLCDGQLLQAADLTVARVRVLDAGTIRRYLDAEPALDCAGSFRCEGLGISLFEAIETRDPTALIGLPLIALAGLLREAGFQLP